jgi:hypothetical protein
VEQVELTQSSINKLAEAIGREFEKALRMADYQVELLALGPNAEDQVREIVRQAIEAQR